MRRNHLDQRYLDDPMFKGLVDQLEAQIRFANFTPTEIREALFLAQMKYESTTVRPITFSPDLMRQLEFMSERRK